MYPELALVAYTSLRLDALLMPLLPQNTPLGAMTVRLFGRRPRNPVDAWDAARRERNALFEVQMVELAVAALRREPSLTNINGVRDRLNYLEKMMRSGDAASSDQEPRHV